MSKGMSLIETLIVISILAILSIAIISVLDPLEQIYRGKDTSLIQTSEILSNAVTRFLVSQDHLPWENEIQTGNLTSQDGETLIVNIISIGELKKNFPSSHNKNLQEIYITSEDDEESMHLCFQPHSNAYKNHPLTSFSQDGIFNPECFTNRGECYFCFGIKNLGEEIADAAGDSTQETNMTEEEKLCSDFDPEFPEYPWTCNNSDALSEFGCTNFCVRDLNCDGFCPEGQRHLQKRYYATNDDAIQCSLAGDDLFVDYCIPDQFARCDIKSYTSRPSDYVWGCTDPRRPYKWIE